MKKHYLAPISDILMPNEIDIIRTSNCVTPPPIDENEGEWDKDDYAEP